MTPKYKFTLLADRRKHTYQSEWRGLDIPLEITASTSQEAIDKASALMKVEDTRWQFWVKKVEELPSDPEPIHDPPTEIRYVTKFRKKGIR